MGKDYGFEPRGLPGWRVFLDLSPRSRGWVFTSPADFPQTFGWDDARQDHVVPKYNNWHGPFSGPDCQTAKAAVAAAHRHHESITAHLRHIANLPESRG